MQDNEPSLSLLIMKKDTESLLEMFTPLLRSKSYLNGIFDEDLYQELTLAFIKSVNKFKQSSEQIELKELFNE